MCKNLILKTLDCSDKFIMYTLQKNASAVSFTADDQCGKHATDIKTVDNLRDDVHADIN